MEPFRQKVAHGAEHRVRTQTKKGALAGSSRFHTLYVVMQHIPLLCHNQREAHMLDHNRKAISL